MAESPKPKVKSIIMDKAPSADTLSMINTLGYTGPDFDALANAFNVAFGTSVTGGDLMPLQTTGDVCDYMETIIPPSNPA